MAKKKWDIQVVCQYPEIITMFDVADFKHHMSMIFSFIIYNRCTCSSQNIQYNRFVLKKIIACGLLVIIKYSLKKMTV